MHTMRRLLTSVLIFGVLLNVQALWGLCGNCCTAPVHTCTSTSKGMLDCPMHRSEHSFEKSRKNCSCDTRAVMISVSEATSSLSEQQKAKAFGLSLWESSYAAGMLIEVRSRPTVYNSDLFLLLHQATQPLPLRI